MKRFLSVTLALLLVFSNLAAFAGTVNIDYNSLSREELEEIIDNAEDAIDRNHSVSGDTKYDLESRIKLDFVKLMPGLEAEPSWPWFDWSYSREWNNLTVVTEVKIDGDWLPLEAMYTDENGSYDLIYMTVNGELLGDQASSASTRENTESNIDTNAEVPDNSPAVEEVVIAKKGDKSNAVKGIQDMLIALGYLSGKADGSYGDKTVDAVSSFQRDHSLEETGIVTESVYVALQDEYLSQPPITPEPKKAKPTPTPKPERISAEKLNDAFQENEVAANQRYKGQIIEVSGKVNSVESGFWGGVTVKIDADEYGVYQINCSMNRDQESKVASLKSGQKIVIRGKCTGKSFIEVELDDCDIVG